MKTILCTPKMTPSLQLQPTNLKIKIQSLKYIQQKRIEAKAKLIIHHEKLEKEQQIKHTPKKKKNGGLEVAQTEDKGVKSTI